MIASAYLPVCRCFAVRFLTSGHELHEYTSGVALPSVFSFLEERFKLSKDEKPPRLERKPKDKTQNEDTNDEEEEEKEDGVDDESKDEVDDKDEDESMGEKVPESSKVREVGESASVAD